MRRATLVAFTTVAAAIACRGAGRTRTATAPESGRTPTLLDEAAAFERGAGVRRDYARAAEIYARMCDDGRGDAEACRRLLDAIGDARGVKRDRDDGLRLVLPMCLAHGTPNACVIASYFVARRDSPPSLVRSVVEWRLENLDEEQAGERCEAGDPRACEAFVALDGMWPSDSETAEFRRRIAAGVLCESGRVEECRRAVREVTACGMSVECVDRLVDDWVRYEDHRSIAALDRVRRWCDAGDAIACSALPGRAIPAAELCAAHDYEACAVLGCRGDAGAAVAAAAHGVEAECDFIGEADQPPAIEHTNQRVPLRADPPLPPITPTHRAPFDSLAFRQLAVRDESGWPRYEVYNLGTRGVRFATVVLYAYDSAGQQLARAGSSVDAIPVGAQRRLERGFGFARGADAGLTYEACYDAIRFERDSTVYRTRCPLVKKRGERWGDGNDAFVLALDVAAPPGVGWRASSARADRHTAAFEASQPGVLVEVAGLQDRGYDATIEISADLAAARGAVRVPLMLAPIAVVYHLDGVDRLRLSRSTLLGIFQGDVKAWNDAAIAKENPGVALPADHADSQRRVT